MIRSFLILLLALGQTALWSVAVLAADVGLSERLDMLIASYPDVLSRVEGNRLILKDGGPAIVIDDGRTKSHAEALVDADVEDMLRQVYPHAPCETRPAVDFDPGRVRSQDLMMRLYGESRRQVADRLTTIDWFGNRLQVTTAFDVDKALIAVRDELKALPENLRRPALKSAGTFNWRNIAGTDRLSVHSFGAAIDLDTSYADYWRWSGGKPGNVPVYKNRVPMEIVEIFERHGFIWGGRWYHYDTMHFEYRPELIAISHAAGADACANGAQ
ncbi:M15 family metallopeptidase [uncultured Roseibium sp.]|uniref:M15 family metallopeptidase n=1 Tax=uncultured Roseibium sp. TaxID=1936171 RepID=UPI003216C53C